MSATIAYIIKLVILIPLVAGLAYGSLWLWRRAQQQIGGAGRRERLVTLLDATPLGATATTGGPTATTPVGATPLGMPTIGPGQAVAPNPLKLVLNWKYQGPQGMFFVADDKGYFKAEGLEVTLDQGNGSAAAVPLVANGTYDVGFGDINALIEFAARSLDIAPSSPVTR